MGLFNILEERDLQIRGFPVRIPLDVLMVFSANPEDYTNRGSIITPLKDRISSQILTHYPPDIHVAADITRQEAWIERDVPNVVIPDDVRLLVEEIGFAARESDLVDQSSGVSARVAISAIELLASNLERRALATRDNPVYPRLCDLHMLLPAITGKVEMVYEGEQQGAEVVARRLVGQAVKKVFDSRFPEIGKEAGSGGEDDRGPYARMIRWFADGNAVTISDEQPFADYEAEIFRVPGLQELAARNGKTREERALAAEMVLEGLHQHLKLARQDLDSQISYKEMVKFQLLKPRRTPGGGGRDRGDVELRHQYFYLDPALIQAILAGLDLLRLFNQLVLATGGDIEEAMNWMRYLQAEGHIPEEIDLEQFFGSLEDQNLVGRNSEGGLQLTSGGERRIRRSAFEEIFSTLDRAGPGYHPIRGAGEGIERLPETRPYNFGDDVHLLDSARSLQNAFRRNQNNEFSLLEEDLEVYETEHLTSCATVVAIDISHSMILYGEDRITPAKTVALALTELITTKYPKDDLSVDPLRRSGRAGVPLRDPLYPGGPLPHQHPRCPAAVAQHPRPAEAAEQADLPDHRRQALGDHRG